MSSGAVRTSRPVRECRRRREALDLDLNRVPPSEVPESRQDISQDPPQGRTNQHRQRQQPVPIDVDAIDDDVVLSSPRAFAEARSKARRTHLRSSVVDVESEEIATRSGNNNQRNRRRRLSSNNSTTQSGLCINLEGSGNIKSKHSANPSPKAPEGPKFSCPICLGTLVDGTTTKCGHIFCKGCIKAAIAAQGKCPTCRKPVFTKDLIRIFLPATG